MLLMGQFRHRRSGSLTVGRKPFKPLKFGQISKLSTGARLSVSEDQKKDQPDARATSLVRAGPRVVEIGEDAAGQRVDNYLTRILKDIPKSRIYKMIRKGEVRVNGGRVKPTTRLNNTDKLRIPPVRTQPPAAEAFIGSRQLKTLERSILHEDDKLLVINKPAGIAVHGGSGVSFGVIEGLRRLRPQCSLELVHRLDRETSGCLLVSKRRSMLRSLHEHIRGGALGKEYRMIVRGNWPATLEKIEAPLHKYVTASGERRVKVSPEGKPSLTSFEVVAGAPDATLLKADLHTGRTHQLRVHCLYAGHGILGDDKYASEADRAADRAKGIQRLCLHAARIVLPDGMVFTAPIPDDLEEIWYALGGRDGPDSAGSVPKNG